MGGGISDGPNSYALKQRRGIGVGPLKLCTPSEPG